MHLVETRDQVIVLGQLRVSTFSRESGKSKKWGPSILNSSGLNPARSQLSAAALVGKAGLPDECEDATCCRVTALIVFPQLL